jgi:hypothetical protein
MMVETVTEEEFYREWLKAYLEKFGGEEPLFGRGFLNDHTDMLIEAIETNTPIENPPKDALL